MKKGLHTFLLILGFGIVLGSCKKEPEINPNQKNPVHTGTETEKEKENNNNSNNDNTVKEEENKDFSKVIKGKYKGTTVTKISFGSTDPVDIEVEIVALESNMIKVLFSPYSSYMNPDLKHSGVHIPKMDISKEGNIFNLKGGEEKFSALFGDKKREYTIYESKGTIEKDHLIIKMKYTHNRMPGDGEMTIDCTKIKE